MDRLFKILVYRSPGFFIPPNRSPAPNAESWPDTNDAMELPLFIFAGGMNDVVEVYRNGRTNATAVTTRKTARATLKISFFPARNLRNTSARSTESSSISGDANQSAFA